MDGYIGNGTTETTVQIKWGETYYHIKACMYDCGDFLKCPAAHNHQHPHHHHHYLSCSEEDRAPD